MHLVVNAILTVWPIQFELLWYQLKAACVYLKDELLN